MGLFDFGFNFSHSNAQVGLDKEDTAWLYQKQSDQWRANTEWYNKNGYSYLKEGLMNAGYNPLMALGASPLNGATVTGSVMNERSNARSLSAQGVPLGKAGYIAQMRNVNADTTLKNAQTEENISRSNLENTQKILADKEIPFKDRMMAASVLGLELENEYKKQLTRNVSADTGLKITQADLNKVQMKYYNALEGLTYSQKSQFDKIVEKLSNDIKLTSADAKWVNDHPKQAEFLNYVSRYGSAIGTILSPALHAYTAYQVGKIGKPAKSPVIQQSGSVIKVNPHTIQY